jgi:hypothetical protein
MARVTYQSTDTNCRRRSWSARGTSARWWGRGASSETRGEQPPRPSSQRPPRINAHA